MSISKLDKKISEEFDEKFSEEHGGCYYGKDIDGIPEYLPESALEDIKQFLAEKLIEAYRQGFNDCLKENKKIRQDTFKKIRGLKKKILNRMKCRKRHKVNKR